MYITDWAQLVRYAFSYMNFCKFGICNYLNIERYDYNTAEHVDINYISSKYNLFPFNPKENQY